MSSCKKTFSAWFKKTSKEEIYCNNLWLNFDLNLGQCRNFCN